MLPKPHRRAAPRAHGRAVIALLSVLSFGILAWSGPQPSTAETLDPQAYLPLAQRAPATATISPSPTQRPHATPTPGSTPTATQEPTETLAISGTTFIRPRYATITQVSLSNAYMVVLDVTASMSWNFAGQGYRNGQAVQCGPGPNRQHCDAEAPWPDATQRRIYAAKQSIFQLIDQMTLTDTMRLIVYSTNGITATTSWSSDKTALYQAVLQAGTYADDSYRTSGEAPTASALYLAGQLVAQLPPSDPNGRPYHVETLLMTDSVANSFLIGDGGWLYDPDTYCPGVEFPEDAVPCYVGYTTTNPPMPKPITAMIQQADPLKQSATIYVIALAGVDETGLKSVASAPNYPYYSASSTGSDLAQIIQDISAKTIFNACVPHGGDTWLNTIDTAHVPDPSAGIPGLSDTIVGYVYLYDQQGHPLPGDQSQAPVHRDPQTGYLSYTVGNLTPGTYQMALFVAYKGDDSITRAYPVLYNPNTGSSDTSVTFVLTSTGTPGPIPMIPLYLDLNGAVCPTL